MKGQIWIAPDFGKMTEEESAEWYRWEYWVRLLIDTHALLWWREDYRLIFVIYGLPSRYRGRTGIPLIEC
jgi:hypothetical protein